MAEFKTRWYGSFEVGPSEPAHTLRGHLVEIGGLAEAMKGKCGTEEVLAFLAAVGALETPEMLEMRAGEGHAKGNEDGSFCCGGGECHRKSLVPKNRHGR